MQQSHWTASQLISRFSRFNEQISCGMVPVNMFPARYKLFKFVFNPSSLGTVPVNRLLFNHKVSRLCNIPSSVGSFPDSKLLSRSTYFNFLPKFPISVGIELSILFENKSNTTKEVISPKIGGKIPPILLSNTSTTNSRSFRRDSSAHGRVPCRLLLFKSNSSNSPTKLQIGNSSSEVCQLHSSSFESHRNHD